MEGRDMGTDMIVGDHKYSACVNIVHQPQISSGWTRLRNQKKKTKGVRLRTFFKKISSQMPLMP